MTDLETSREILNLLHELNTTIKCIDSKIDNEVNLIEIDESLGDFHIRKCIKPPVVSKKTSNDKSKSESESESKKDIAATNVYHLSKDIEDGVNDICLGMQKYYIDIELNALAYDIRNNPLNSEKYYEKLENVIDELFLNMVSEIRPRIDKLHIKLIEKYINGGRIKLLKPFWDDADADPNQVRRYDAIIHWNS